MNRSFWRIVGFVVGISVVGAIAAFLVGPYALTPNAVVRKELFRTGQDTICLPEAIEDFEVLGQRSRPIGTIVVFRAVCAQRIGSPKTYLFGYNVVSRHGLLWRSKISGLSGRSENVPQILRISCCTDRQNEQYAITLGQLDNRQTARVEATFADGQTLQDDGNDNIFALATTGTQSICEIRFFDTQGKVLRHDRTPANDCPPQ